MLASQTTPSHPVPRTRTWLADVHGSVDAALGHLFSLPDESGLDPRWTRAMLEARRYSLRPAKRLRPALLAAGYGLARGGFATSAGAPEGFWHFAAGFELLHTFMLIHDDVADQAQLRRGAKALHRLLGPGRVGEDLAIVVGDHLFARAIEAMLESGLPGSVRAVQEYLGVCRHTAAGQFLDLDLTRAPLGEVTLFQALKVAHLKTARYGFVAPLLCGARLGGGDVRLLTILERVGRHVGVAYQLRDDVIGLFGDNAVSGKSCDSDFAQGKRTFPVLAAYTRAPESVRPRFDALWSGAVEDGIHEARALVKAHGGLEATERLIARATRWAGKALEGLPAENPLRDLLGELIVSLARRCA